MTQNKFLGDLFPTLFLEVALRYLERRKSKMNVKAIFKEVYGNNPNFITPEITRYVKITEDILGELSQGSGMFGSNTIYAITYLIYENNQWVKQHETERELENVFRSEEEREEYIRQIRSVF